MHTTIIRSHSKNDTSKTYTIHGYVGSANTCQVMNLGGNVQAVNLSDNLRPGGGVRLHLRQMTLVPLTGSTLLPPMALVL